MLFSSITFIYYFLPLVILAYYLTPKKYRNVTLLVSSLIFYFYGEKNPVLVIACVLNYFLGLIIGKSDKDNKKSFLILGIVLNFLALGYYKYSNFFIENFNNILNVNIRYLSVILPLGISFFTFQNVSYLIDVYRGDIEAQKSVVKYGTYITFFPQLIAGPIVRYKDINEEIEDREESFDNFGQGVRRFIIGLSKKVLIANVIGEMCSILGAVGIKSVMTYILQAIGFTLQIYFDFSGYSDMAIGLGLFFGFHIKENFNYPLIASSITDFWRRWHMSLSSFFRDYVYIPLGGNRKGLKRQILNILIVWSLTGFWHGASWNFVLWGVYFFVFLVIEKVFLLKHLKGGFFSHLYTIILVLISFVIFNVEQVSQIGVFLKSMIGLNCIEFMNFETWYYLKNYIVILLMGIICATPIVKNLLDRLANSKNRILSFLELAIYIILLIVCSASLISNSFNPFIYFRF